MLIISDTNILSSLAAGAALPLLWRLFPSTVIHIPPIVEEELQAGLAHGELHLNVVLKAIESHNLQILRLSRQEQQLADALPKKIKHSQSQAVALCQIRDGILLSNHRRTIRYCDRNQVDVLDLIDILRLLREQEVIPKYKIKEIMIRMERVEGMTFSNAQRKEIFDRHRTRKTPPPLIHQTPDDDQLLAT